MNNIDRLHLAQQRAMSTRPKTHAFPHLAEALRLAGVRKNYFDVASGGALYLLGDGSVYQPGVGLHRESVEVPRFDQAALLAAVEADKAGQITFPEFLERSWAAGVVRYEVDTDERTCTYIGVLGEQYVESYPAVTPTPPGTIVDSAAR